MYIYMHIEVCEYIYIPGQRRIQQVLQHRRHIAEIRKNITPLCLAVLVLQIAHHFGSKVVRKIRNVCETLHFWLWQDFSKVSSIVIVHTRISSEVTFENSSLKWRVLFF